MCFLRLISSFWWQPVFATILIIQDLTTREFYAMSYSVSDNCKKFKAISLEELFFQTCDDWLSILKTLKIQKSLD